jgi:DNA-binding transcriptional LysR family regulator
MDLDLRDLAFFLAVERQGSFGRAASELMVTQPAVSERVRHLERLVGRALFERTSRGAVLTPTGTALLPYARRCVALADETLEAARRAEGVPALVIAVHSTFAPRIVPFVLGTLTTLPRRVAVRDVHSEDVHALVLDGAADIGFALTASVPRGLQRVPLPPDAVVCVAAPGHPIAHIPRPAPASLKDSLIAVNAWGDGTETFLDRLDTAGVEDWRVRYCADAATAIALARDHAHIAFVTRSATEPQLSARTLRTVPMTGMSGWTVRLDLLHRSSDRNDAVVRALIDAVHAA